MAFHEVRFPTRIAFGSSFGPTRKTDVVTLASGYEERNATWLNSRRRGNVGYGVKSLNDVHTIIRFWEARSGRLYGFRYKDKLDFKSCEPDDEITALDQSLGNGNGTAGPFQLVKLYSDVAGSWTRKITKPVAGTVRVAVAGIEQTITTDFTVDTTTGLVTFTLGHYPTSMQAVTAGFEFDVPVRFDSDEVEINLSSFDAGEIPQIPIIEIRDP